MTLDHDVSVEVDALDIYNLLDAPYFGATECIYCMIAAAARRNLTGCLPSDVRPEPYEVLEGEGGELAYGWTHYMRMEIKGEKQLVLIEITDSGAAATGELEERRIEEFESVLDILNQIGGRVKSAPHDCETWEREIWAEDSSGTVTWRAGSFSDLPTLLRLCGDRAARVLLAARTSSESGDHV